MCDVVEIVEPTGRVREGIPNTRRGVYLFVEATQRGYAAGLRIDEHTLIERYFRESFYGGDGAYCEACKEASGLLTTWKLKPRLIRRRKGFRPAP